MEGFEQFLSEEGRETFQKACKLNDVDAQSDPESDPYKSKYKAREYIQDLKTSVEKYMNQDPNEDRLKYSLAVIDLKLGSNYIETEEIATGEEHLMKCLAAVEDKKLDKRACSIYNNVCNQLGILWCERSQPLEAQKYLERAENCYKIFTQDIGGSPMTVDEIFASPVDESDDNAAQRRHEYFEDTYTLSLYYLAQVYTRLDETKKSAEYCLKTLRRQLESKKYTPIEWALNAATLSQYYIGIKNYTLARHCLASATLIIQEAGEPDPNLKPSDEESQADVDNREKIPRARAGIERCWGKYGISLLEDSKENLLQDLTGEINEKGSEDNEPEQVEGASNNEDPPKKSVLFDLELTAIEEQITDKLVLDFEQARAVFLVVQKWLNSAKDFYVLDGHCSDHVEIIQDQSRLFKELAFFEPHFERQSKMHKRRVDMISSLLKELNPQYYLLVCRQLIYELADTYSTMVDLKLAIMEEGEQTPTPHSVKKINQLTNQSIQQYQAYIDTLRNQQRELPKRFSEDDERPALIAFFFVGRLYSKFIESSIPKRIKFLESSLENYKFVVDYCKSNPDACEVVKSELEICQEMAQLLPHKIYKIKHQE